MLKLCFATLFLDFTDRFSARDFAHNYALNSMRRTRFIDRAHLLCKQTLPPEAKCFSLMKLIPKVFPKKLSKVGSLDPC